MTRNLISLYVHVIQTAMIVFQFTFTYFPFNDYIFISMLLISLIKIQFKFLAFVSRSGGCAV